MRRATIIRHSGPFICESLVNGHILIKPAWSQYERVWNLEEGGGPGIFTRMELARCLQHWLNAPYDVGAQLEIGLERISQHDRNLAKADKLDQKRARKGYKPSPHDPKTCPLCRTTVQDDALAEVE